MYNGYKIVIVTPAGRERFLEILLRYSLCNREIIDRHDLWLNTNIKSDIEFIENISKFYPEYFRVVKPNYPINHRPVESISQFYRYCTEKNTIYIKLDDDICYIGEESLKNLIKFRIENRDAFLVYPIIICTGMEWLLDVFSPVVHWEKTPNSCALEHIRRHVEFLSDPSPYRYFCSPYKIPQDYSVSINCISWFGEDFASFKGIVPNWPISDEDWLTITKTNELKKNNIINGSSVLVHFSYTHNGTMKFLESHTDLRDRYLTLSKKILPNLLPEKKIISFF